MRLGLHATVLLFCTIAVAGCATTAGGARADMNVLTAEELEELGPGISAHEAIERLRPTWLRDRGVSSPNPNFEDDTLPRLHIDLAPQPLEALHSLRITDIQVVRFMNARDATTRFGTGYVNGLIEVTTRGGSRPVGGG